MRRFIFGCGCEGEEEKEKAEVDEFVDQDNAIKDNDDGNDFE